MANWEGYEELRQKVIHDAPHFGNADQNADAMMRWVLEQYYGFTKKCYSKRAKVFKAGLYGAADHVGQGYTTWATPDGRLAGTPIADAASPAQGRDVNGPTAVRKSSSTWFPPRRCARHRCIRKNSGIWWCGSQGIPPTLLSCLRIARMT